MWFKAIDFKLKQLLLKKFAFISILIVCLFHQGKINQLKTSKIPKAFFLTQPGNSETIFFCPLKMRAILGIKN